MIIPAKIALKVPPVRLAPIKNNASTMPRRAIIAIQPPVARIDVATGEFGCTSNTGVAQAPTTYSCTVSETK